jgi:hypothetical protein
MARWNYLHHLEYRRELSKWERVLLYIETAEDHGFCFHKKGMTRTQWHEHYTRLCAADFLDRKGADPGIWLVTTVRELPDKRITLCTVRFRWAPERVLDKN